MNFGDRLRAERLRLGYRRQADWAKMCGVTGPTQSLYETGGRSPDAVYLERACAAGADALFLLTGVPSPARLAVNEAEAQWFAAGAGLPPKVRDAMTALAGVVANAADHDAASRATDVTRPSFDE